MEEQINLFYCPYNGTEKIKSKAIDNINDRLKLDRSCLKIAIENKNLPGVTDEETFVLHERNRLRDKPVKNGIKNAEFYELISLSDVYNIISCRRGAKTIIIDAKPLRAHIENIRACSDKKKRTQLKQTLPYVTFSGSFLYRSDLDLVKHSGLVCIDVDEIGFGMLEKLKHDIFHDAEYKPCLIFVSPSGNGLKIVYRVEAMTAAKQRSAYIFLSEYLGGLYGIVYGIQSNIDASCKDVSRACFLSYDPNALFNEHNTCTLPDLQEDAPRHTPQQAADLTTDESYLQFIKGRKTNALRTELMNANFAHELVTGLGFHSPLETKSYGGTAYTRPGKARGTSLHIKEVNHSITLFSDNVPDKTRMLLGEFMGGHADAPKNYDTKREVSILTIYARFKGLNIEKDDAKREWSQLYKVAVKDGYLEPGEVEKRDTTKDETDEMFAARFVDCKSKAVLLDAVTKRLLRENKYIFDNNIKEFRICVDNVWVPLEVYYQKYKPDAENILEARIGSLMGLNELLNSTKEVISRLKNRTVKNRWDRLKPHQIPVKNGILDIYSGELIPYEKKYRCTRRFNAEYIKDAPAPRFETFMDEIFEGNEDKAEIIDRVQTLCGTVLSEHTHLEKCLLLLGDGLNGKSVFIDILKNIVGQAAALCSIEQLDKPESMINLVGKTMGYCHDINFDATVKTSVFKSFIGGEDLSVREFYHRAVTVKMVATQIYGANRMPRTIDKTDGLTRRFLVVECKNKVMQPDAGLRTKLYKEAPGVLNWLIQGLKKAIKLDCLPTLVSSDRLMSIYKESQNAEFAFLRCLSKSEDTRAFVKIIDVYRMYVKFCHQNGFYDRRDHLKSAELRELICRKLHVEVEKLGRSDGYLCYMGLDIDGGIFDDLEY